MSEDHVVIKCCNVSKSYRLSGSPRDRLVRPLKHMFKRALPDWLVSKEEAYSDFSEFHALRDISFEVRKGESWGIIGQNGSGKSTLLRIISGNIRPTGGFVEVDGKVAILNYSSGFNKEFTGRENIYIKCTMLGLSRREIDSKVQAIEDFAEIGEFMDQPVRTYSSGMVARLGFAVMAHVGADILISDEALAVGDAFFVQKCMRHIRGFLESGTFLFVSHSVNDVMALCDKVIWLEHGRIVRIGPAKDVCRAYLDTMIQRGIDRRNEAGTAEAPVLPPPADEPVSRAADEAAASAKPGAGKDKAVVPARERKTSVSIDGSKLAKLKQYYSAPVADSVTINLQSFVQVDSPGLHGGSGRSDMSGQGGRIFSVELANDDGKVLKSVLGGEVVRLTIRVVAEKFIRRPLIGFQLKNNLGLPLVAENTHFPMGDEDFSLEAGDVAVVTFRFALPLLAAGEYVVRAAFHDGTQKDNVVVDVLNEALLLHCSTTGDRHGWVGVPLLGVEITRETNPLEIEG